MRQIFLFLGVTLFLSLGKVAFSLKTEEYQGQTGLSKGLAGGGAAFVSGLDSLRINPALLTREKRYKFLASYGTPSNEARSFFSLGLVDSFSSPVAGGLSYSSFVGPYDEDDSNNVPINNRIHVGSAFKAGAFSFGLAGQRLNFYRGDNEIDAYFFNVGLNLDFLNSCRLSISAENLYLDDSSYEDIDLEQVYRAGLAVSFGDNEDLTLLLDYQQRDNNPLDQRVAYVIGGAQLKLGSEIVIMGGYSHELTKLGDGDSFALGISLLSDVMELSYGFKSTLPWEEGEVSHSFSMAYALS